MIIFTDLREFYRFVQNAEYDIRIDRKKRVWNKNEIIAKFRRNDNNRTV